MGAPNGSSSISATRFPSHQLSNGLYVSGHPDQHKDRSPTMSVPQMPYTGGDIKKSGELGKMFDILVDNSGSPKPKKMGSTAGGVPGSSSSHSGPLLSQDGTILSGLSSTAMSRQGSNVGSSVSKSGPLVGNRSSAIRQVSKSGPLTRSGNGDLSGGNVNRKGSHGLAVGSNSSASYSSGKFPNGTTVPSSISGVPSVGKTAATVSLAPALQATVNTASALPVTGLITSGPLTSGPLTTGGAYRQGPLDANGMSTKPPNVTGVSNQAINNLSHEQEYFFRTTVPRVLLWTVLPLFVMGFIAGAFIIAAVGNAILLIIVSGLFIMATVLLLWNIYFRRKSVMGFLVSIPDSELGSANDGQFVKITGVVTCGSVPLQSSYLKVNRCIYTSTKLHEYRSLSSKPAKEKHRHLTWGVRHSENHIVDFYISDLQSGVRALVKAGYGARVAVDVEETVVADFRPIRKVVAPDFLRWLSEMNLCTGDRPMRLKEGYVKEGSTVTVFGMLQRQENVLTIVPPTEPSCMGCQWSKLLFPSTFDGLALVCHDMAKNEGIPL